MYRLARKAFKDDLNGTGAEKFGGRWNNIGVPMLYASEHQSLCVLEFAVHTHLTLLPKDLFMITLELPPDKKAVTAAKGLPYNWHQTPHHNATQVFGDDFIREGAFLALRVPSAIVPGEFNLIINPNHALAEKIRIADAVPFAFDQRLLQ